MTTVPVTAVVIGQPSLFARATCNGFAKAVSSCAVCGVPAPSTSSFGGLLDGHELLPVPPEDPVGADCARASGLVAAVRPPVTTIAPTVHATRTDLGSVRISPPSPRGS